MVADPAQHRELSRLREWQQRAMTLFVRIDRDRGDTQAMRQHCAAGQELVDEGLIRFRKKEGQRE